MPAVQLRRFEQILGNMISLVVARTDLSDMVDTSRLKHILAATAREMDEAYYQLTRVRDSFDIQKAAGEDLDERAAEIQPGTLRRLQARRAIGQVRFSRVSTIGTISIPSGTLLKTADGVVFKTTLQGEILNGNDESELVPISSDALGTDGNVPSGTIIKFGAKPSGVDAVTNPSATSQGRNKESDDGFRARIQNFVGALSRCTVDALEFAAIGAEDPDSGKSVVFAHVFQDPVLRGKVTLYIDDGAGTASTFGTPVTGELVTANLAGPPAGSAVGGEEFLYLAEYPVAADLEPVTITSSTRGVLTSGTDYYLNPATGRLFFSPPLAPAEEIEADYTPFSGLIPVVQRIVEGDPDDRANFPGYRAAGVDVRVLSPTVVTMQVEALLHLAPGVDRAVATAAAKAAVEDYINTLGISGDVIRHEIIERIMEVAGVVDVDLVLPTTNLATLDDQIRRINSGNISIT